MSTLLNGLAGAGVPIEEILGVTVGPAGNDLLGGYGFMAALTDSEVEVPGQH
ncbi:hypothetical protein [Corynebacterium gerontici]|uniref:hypothetical protein n=1 Tax=Corynebacterium gerontici TaxID=2079234 RepID=UPI0013DD8A0F|nr:hypothetical protein [Corynebacterium gerontici]